ANRVHQVFTVHLLTGFLLELIFLQPREHHFGEVAVAVVLRRGQRHCVLQAAFLQVLGNLRGEQFRLVPRLLVRKEPLNTHAERPHRHDNEHEGDGLRNDRHTGVHFHQVHGPSSIETKLRKSDLKKRLRENVKQLLDSPERRGRKDRASTKSPVYKIKTRIAVPVTLVRLT